MRCRTLTTGLGLDLIPRGAFVNTEYSGCGVDYESKDKLDVPQEKKLS